jgi:hypothetical protein
LDYRAVASTSKNNRLLKAYLSQARRTELRRPKDIDASAIGSLATLLSVIPMMSIRMKSRD